MKKSSKIAIAAAAVGAWLLVKKKKVISGIGAVDWYHARWRAEKELGIDFSKSYFEQSWDAVDDLAKLGKKMGYRRSYDNGKSYGRAFYDAIKQRTHDIYGVGKILEENYYGIQAVTTDGRHMVQFSVRNDGIIDVDAFMPTSMSDRDYMGEWEYWFRIGSYTTMKGAIRSAKKLMAEMGYKLDARDFENF